MASRTGGRAPPGSTLPRRTDPAPSSVKPTGFAASCGALRITISVRRPGRLFPYKRRTPSSPGVVQPSAVTPFVAHASRYGRATRTSLSGVLSATCATASTRWNRASLGETTKKSLGCGPSSLPFAKSTDTSSVGNGVNVGPPSTRSTPWTSLFQNSASHQYGCGSTGLGTRLAEL